ncbi:SDR family NAD(P)-dependent oxidoreductase [Nonomuraea sp. MG754425]|uniref:type I polyketide synthase n=1 Tax=Nonomuraea sp. MG754425 TaxID=2570319 RepID=UPI002351BEEF|nr:type I polyketide synthase [Nonomuraea sp. MG754425]MCF6473387.1 SDR family NAD(P)-dependent oxidoreductase [Nonomuraea sp. MG754425]
MRDVDDVPEAIAVVGMACRMPGASDLDQFWRNLAAGNESVTERGEDELRACGVTEEELANPDFVRRVPLMPDPEYFDAAFFRMTPREAVLCDPQIRVFLEICHSAVENAGYDPFALRDSVGVFGSVGPNGYLPEYLYPRPDLTGSDHTLAQTLNQPDYLATLVAYKLNLHGPAMTVLSACSSTLVALHVAAQALRSGECDVALVGGSVMDPRVTRGRLWTPHSITSRDGHCRPFDAAASGTVFGSGAGAVVLKREADAVADRDRILARVLGSAVNNDGAQRVSFSAPGMAGQVAVVKEAMLLAGVSPLDIGYVEAHGTGTALGDPLEVGALAKAYAELSNRPLPLGSCVLGSVKSNVGHVGAAAGIVGFIKTVLALDHGGIPATVNLKTVNPRLELDRTPFRINTELLPWPRTPGLPRTAAVTSLGIGGTNAHVILGEGPPSRERPGDARPRVVIWSAGSPAGEKALRSRLGAFFADQPETVFSDAVATLQHGRTAHPVRGALVADSAATARELLRGESARVATGRADAECSVAFLFPGQGAGYGGMARELYGTVRAFTIAMDECVELFEQQGAPLYAVLTGGSVEPAASQPLLFSVEYALAAMWREWGVTPATVLGHSLGEVAAAAVAGVFSLPDAVRLVAARSTAMIENPVPGGMLAVGAGEDRVRPLLHGSLALAAVNGERQVVVAGPEDELAVLSGTLTAQRIAARRLEVAAAFHHPGWRAAARVWNGAFDGIAAAPATIPLYSATTGGRAGPEELADPDHWTTALATPVRFHDALGALLGTRPSALLEVGPQATLAALARGHRDASWCSVITTLRRGSPDHESVLDAAARLWVAGQPIDWSAAGQTPPDVRVPVPGYPYERVRYWPDPPAPVSAPPASADDPAVGGATSEIGWVEQAGPGPSRTGLDEHAVLVLLPENAEDAEPVLRAVRLAGLRSASVRRGPSFAALPDGFQVRPGAAEDLERVMEALHLAGTAPWAVIDAVGTTRECTPGGDGAHALNERFADLLALVRLATSSDRWASRARLMLIATRSADISGSEEVEPSRAALHALIRTLGAELPSAACSAVDIDARVKPELLAAELLHERPEPGVVLRGRRRWTRVERPLPPLGGAPAPLREGGVYLITGGIGGLGLQVAKGLAGTGAQPRLALLARHAPDEATEAVLAEIRAQGAAAEAYVCDVTDLAGLERTLDRVTDRWGPVNGVFHLAGLPGGRMLAFRQAADAAAVLAPKVVGMSCLESAFAHRSELDFTVCFSSRAAVDGLLGNADYAVANAYLDAAAGVSRLAGGRVLSIGWPVWRAVGMSARSGVDISALNQAVRAAVAEHGEAPAGVRSAQAPEGAAGPDGVAGTLVWEAELSAFEDWVLDEHRAGRVPLLPGTAYLDLAVHAFREVASSPGPEPIELSDIVFRAPFLDERARLIRLAFRPDKAGTQFDLEVSSRPVGGDGPPVVHLTARISRTPVACPKADLDALRRRFDADATPASPRRGGRVFTLGPRWRNLTAIRTVGAEQLLRVELPRPFHSDVLRHALHPAMLDTAMSAVRGGASVSSVPFFCRKMVVYNDLPAGFHAHVRRDVLASVNAPSGNLDLIDDTGAVLACVEGFTMMEIDEDRLREAAARGSARPAAARGAGSDGLDPATGVELLLRLLGSGMTGHVLIRPFADDRPVPLERGRPGTLAPSDDEVAGRPYGGVAGRPEGEVAGSARAGAASVESSSVEDVLGDLWARLLGIPGIRPDQDFFDVGGNSLTLVELVARIRDTFGVELSLGLLLEGRTLSSMAELVRERSVRPSEEERPASAAE